MRARTREFWLLEPNLAVSKITAGAIRVLEVQLRKRGWANARLADGFIRSAFYWHRLVRLKYPDELLGETTAEAQGENLGAWVVEAFRSLADNVPPC
jgi:hypothetical protein